MTDEQKKEKETEADKSEIQTEGKKDSTSQSQGAKEKIALVNEGQFLTRDEFEVKMTEFNSNMKSGFDSILDVFSSDSREGEIKKVSESKSILDDIFDLDNLL